MTIMRNDSRMGVLFLCSIMIWCQLWIAARPSCFVVGFSLPSQLRRSSTSPSSSSLLSVTAAPAPPLSMERERDVERIVKRNIPAVTELNSIQEFSSFIDDFKSDDLQVIKYYASYCKTCRRVKPIYQRISIGNDDDTIQFGSIEVSVIGGTPTLQSLGITKLPFVQIYRNSKCVASFSTGAQTYNFSRKVKETILACQQRTAQKDGWNTFLTAYETEIQEQRNAVDSLLHKKKTAEP